MILLRGAEAPRLRGEGDFPGLPGRGNIPGQPLGSLSENAGFLGAQASCPPFVQAGGPRSQGKRFSGPWSDSLLAGGPATGVGAA